MNKKFTKSKCIKALFVVLRLCLVNSASGQIIFGQPPSAQAGIIYQSWTITDNADSESTLTQWVIPITAYIPLAENWEMMLSSSTAGTDLESPQSADNNLSGLNDTRVIVYHALMNDKLMLGLGLNLPTGKKALDEDEIGVANLLTESFLSMPVKNYGEGIGLNLECGYADQYDIYTYGGGVGYTYKGSYEPLSGADNYKPGDHFRLGVFGAVKRNEIFARLGLRYNIYGMDKLDDEDVFKDGDMFETRFVVGYTTQQAITSLGMKYILRSKHDRLIAGDLQTEPEKSHGNELLIYGQTAFRLTEVFTLRAMVEYTSIAANGYEDEDERFFGSSNYFGIGAGGSAELTDIFSVIAEFKYLSGVADDDRLDLSGYEVASGIRAVF
jgi:hypothetical protein